MERSAEKRTLWKITPSARVKWEGRFCYKFTHPRLGESNNYFLNETVLLSCQDASENGILLQFPTIKKIQLITLSGFYVHVKIIYLLASTRCMS